MSLPEKKQIGLIDQMRYNPDSLIKLYTSPVLIIQGEKDIQVSVKDAELLKAAQPSAKLILFPQMNHVLKNFTGTDITENMKTYSNPALPLTPGLATAIAQFVKR